MFRSFRIKIGIGRGGGGFTRGWLHRAAVAMGPAGFVAAIAGRVTAKVGRQPFTIHRLLPTAHARSPIAAPAVAASLALETVYVLVFGAGTYHLR